MSALQYYVRRINNCSEYLSSLISQNPSVLSGTYGTFATLYGEVAVRPFFDEEEPYIVIGYPTMYLAKDVDSRIDFAAYFMLDSGTIEAEFDVKADNQYTPHADELREASNNLSRSLGILFGDYARYLQASYNQGTAKEVELDRVSRTETIAPEKLFVENLPYNRYVRDMDVAITVSSVPAPSGVETVLFVLNGDYVSVSIEEYGAMQVTAGRINERGSVQSWERPQTGTFGDFTLPKDYLKGLIQDESINLVETLFNTFMAQYK